MVCFVDNYSIDERLMACLTSHFISVLILIDFSKSPVHLVQVSDGTVGVHLLRFIHENFTFLFTNVLLLYLCFLRVQSYLGVDSSNMLHSDHVAFTHQA